MKILVIGGTSFIGNAMVKNLIELNYDIDILVESKGEIILTKPQNIVYCTRKRTNELKDTLIKTRYDYILDINTKIEADVMCFLNQSSKDNIGKYILCSSNDVFNSFKIAI